jgi:hypothetical protein
MSINEIDPQEREYLKAKYIPDRVMDPELNSTVQTIERAKQLEAKAFARGTDYNQWLFDPSRSPEMHAVAAKAHRDLNLAIACGDIECDDSTDDTILVHFVDSREAYAVERGKSGERFATSLRRHNATQPFCDDYRCNIQIADECAANDGSDCAGGSTMLLPLRYGGVLLVFECCGACHRVARETAETNYKIGVMEAHQRAAAAPLPVWARRAPWWLRVRAAIGRRSRRR